MADRYWVGGSGTWNSVNTANWSATSGGAGGASVPTSADDVYFNSASNATLYTVTTPGNITDMICRSLNVAGPLVGNVTFSNTNSRINIYGSLTHAASGVVWGASVAFQFSATTIGNTITSNNFTFNNVHTYDGVGGEWILQGHVTTATNRNVTLTNGSINLNNFKYSMGFFSSNNTNIRSISFGAGDITLTGNNLSVFNISNQTGLTFTGTPTVNAIYAGSVGTRTFRLGSSPATFFESTAINLNVTGGTDIINCSIAGKNVNFTGFAGSFISAVNYIYGDLIFSAGMTISPSVNGFVFAATSGTQQITTNGLTLDFPITFNGIGGAMAFQDALTQGSTRAFTITNGTVQLKNGVTSTVGAFATSGTNQKFLQSTLAGAQATISQASGIVNASYLTIKDIIATGGATWNAFVSQGNADAGNNTGWDFLVQLGRYMYTRRKNKRILPA